MEDQDDVESWLGKVKKGDPEIIDFSFPSDQLKREYLATLEKRSEDEVVDLLRNFLISSGSLGADEFALSWTIHQLKKEKLRRLSQFQRRLLLYAGSCADDREGESPPPWEGITWVLDLLPHNPRGAIGAIDAYFEAHCLVMPDGRMHGVADAIEVIRAKFIERPRSSDDAIRLLLNESSRTFEHLVDRLYSAMGYATVLTPNQKDGGYDVLATKDEPGRRAVLHIERWRAGSPRIAWRNCG